MTKSFSHGKNISDVEVQHISTHGIWIYVLGKEYFLPHDQFPWFKDAKISSRIKAGDFGRFTGLDLI